MKCNEKLQTKMKSTKKHFSYIQKCHKIKFGYSQKRLAFLNDFVYRQQLQ